MVLNGDDRTKTRAKQSISDAVIPSTLGYFTQNQRKSDTLMTSIILGSTIFLSAKFLLVGFCIQKTLMRCNEAHTFGVLGFAVLLKVLHDGFKVV